jgi:hypothetical protein
MSGYARWFGQTAGWLWGWQLPISQYLSGRRFRVDFSEKEMMETVCGTSMEILSRVPWVTRSGFTQTHKLTFPVLRLSHFLLVEQRRIKPLKGSLFLETNQCVLILILMLMATLAMIRIRKRREPQPTDKHRWLWPCGFQVACTANYQKAASLCKDWPRIWEERGSWEKERSKADIKTNGFTILRIDAAWTLDDLCVDTGLIAAVLYRYCWYPVASFWISRQYSVNTSGKAGAQIPQLPLGDDSSPWGR